MAVDSIEGHWAIIGKDSGAPTGQRFNVRQEPVELDPAELGIAERYLGQAIKSVTRSRDSGTAITVPVAEAQQRIAVLPDAAKREQALYEIVTELCAHMNQRGTPNPGIVFALSFNKLGVRSAALIKADLNQKQLAQLTETSGNAGRIHLADAVDIVEEPQSDFAKVLFSPAPYDASLQYAVLDRKSARSQSAAYFLRALGVRSTSQAGTLRRVIDAVGKEMTPDKRARTIDRVLAATESERGNTPGQPITLERLGELVPEAAPAMERLREQEPTRITAVGAEDRVTRVWTLKEPGFRLEADSRIQVTGPRAVGEEWQITIRLPAEPMRER